MPDDDMRKVLLVEDEPMVRELTAELLADAGFNVTAACTGDEAAILLADTAFAILLTDINMPGQIDGIGLAEHARQLHPHLPVVFLSGRPDTELRAREVSPPIAFLIKPYDTEHLVGTVTHMAVA